MNMKIENQIELLKNFNKIKVFGHLIRHNNFSKNRKKSIAFIKAFGNPKHSFEGMITSKVVVYFQLLKHKHKILEEELT